jgi:hypothetical protein
MVQVEIKGDPDPIVDINTPEAAAEFKRLRDLGFFGHRNQAELMETWKRLDLYEAKYEDKMSYEDFCELYADGALPEAE